MAIHNRLGNHGEKLAGHWLEECGYKILHRNWRYKYQEIDIIAEKDGTLHFIEVKTRRASKFGFPEDSVTKRKFSYLKTAADQFLHQHPGFEWIQYDILSIIVHRNKAPDFYFIEDVFL